jgi:hypothetical protein
MSDVIITVENLGKSAAGGTARQQDDRTTRQQDNGDNETMRDNRQISEVRCRTAEARDQRLNFLSNRVRRQPFTRSAFPKLKLNLKTLCMLEHGRVDARRDR